MEFCHKKYTFDIAKDPATGRWLLDTSGYRWHHLDRFPEHITVKDCYAVNLVHTSAFDLRIVRNTAGEKAFFFVTDVSEEFGDLYRSGGSGFHYKDIVLYCSDRRSLAEGAPVFLLAEDLSGEWSAFMLLYQPVILKSFFSCFEVVSGCKDEDDVKARLLLESGVDLDDGEVFTRADEALADDTVRREEERLNQF